MAYPPLHRKLFKSDGAGPELKEEIVPHELTKRVTAPDFALTTGERIFHNIGREGKYDELHVIKEDGGASIILRGANAPDAKNSVSIKAGSDSSSVYWYNFANDGTVSLPGQLNTAGGIKSSAGVIQAVQFTAVNGVNNNIDFADTVHGGGWTLIERTHPDNSWSALVTTYGTQTINGWIEATGFHATSDARKKEVLEPVSYDLSSISCYRYNFIGEKAKHVGLIAQEVQQVIPEAVIADKDGTLSLEYNAVVAALVEEVNALKRRCDSLESAKVSAEARIAAQEKANAMLASTVSALQNAIGALEAKA